MEKQSIVVLGLGMTGLSVVRFLTQYYTNCDIKVIDTRAAPEGIKDLPKHIACHTGSFNRDWLLSANLIIASPGIALSTPILQEALAKNIEIIGDIELFARHVNAPVLAITGSNGKSTVTALVGEMASADNIKVGVGGNIGLAALELLKENCELYVLELSSFQLETTHSLSLLAGAFLNLSEDHLDRYDNMQAYRQAKLDIFSRAQIAIINAEDGQTHPKTHSNSISFGFANADYKLKKIEGKSWLCAKNTPVIKACDIALVGRHNIANCLAAMALADSAGIGREAQIRAMQSYQGLAHRCEKIIQHKGVLWVNDSKATNPASTIAALDGLELEGKLHLLLGGDGKGADFNALVPVLKTLDVALYCFGKDGEKLMLNDDAILVDTMQQAMQLAANHAKSGDMVLLSPACASLDQFTSYIERGRIFANFAQGLTLPVTKQG